MIQGIEKLLPASERDDFHAALYRFSDRCIRLRVDRKIDEIPFATEPVAWFEGGYRILDHEVRPGGFLSYAAADFYIQDAASLLPLQLLNVQTDDRILDLCAAPGGKSSAIAERLGTNGVLVANEAIQSRLDVLRHNLARTGRANYATSSLDPDLIELRCNDLFNKILVDVPCSGQTLVGPGKHDASAFRPQHIEHCAGRARRILGSAARMLAPGGMLVLATCTFSPEENESQIEWLEQTFPDTWEPIELPNLRAWQSPLRHGCYRLWPHRDRCRGGFAAALRKTKETPSVDRAVRRAEPRTIRDRRPQSGRRVAEKGLDGELWLGQLGHWPIGYQLQSTTITVAEAGLAQFLKQMEDCSAFQVATAAMIAGKHWEPTHALALANGDWFVPCREVPLSDSDATAFMTGQSLPTDGREHVTPSPMIAWARALWRGRPIGWLKESANRWNNHLPPWGRMNINASSNGRGLA